MVYKRKFRVHCSVCHLLRIVTVFDREGAKEVKSEIERNKYVCSDHSNKEVNCRA
jgi:hypothetical protein